MSRIFEIGALRLDADVGVVTLDGRPMALGPRAVAVLEVLVEHANEFVPKQRVLDGAWPGVVVEEGNRAVQIAAIRRVLAQGGGESRIETLARRGYRIVGPVVEAADRRVDDSTDRRFALPVPLTSFVGRERELLEIRRLLPSKRLVTIAGIGGIGKTRLALQAAAEVVDAYRDGVRLVEFASVSDSSLVPASVAHALGVEQRTGRSPVESICAYLKPRQLLLILDNCEHLLDACAHLVDTVLSVAGEATILATSREPLRVGSEQIYLLPPLSLPERGSSDPGAMRRSEAVQLFVERVQRQLPDFALTPDRAPAVAEVCIHLDGIPLALELAAARARSLSVEQINARLGERFRLLTGGSRTALPRQQTLRATLDWSYDLLGEDERVVLRRLSVFPGSFTVEAASAVASDAGIDAFAIIDLLSQLVARSLVIADTTTGRTRYGLLETTRAYAAEKLDEGGETNACKRLHAVYFTALFERSQSDWMEMPDAEVHASYDPELAHVRAALDWALGSDGDAAIGIALAGSSGPLWVTLGLYSEGARRLEAAVAQIEPRMSESDQARLWHWLGLIIDETPSRSQPALERAVELYRRLDDSLGLGLSLARLGRVLVFMGRFEEAERVLTEARPLLERVASPRALGFYLFNFAYLKSQTGDAVAARKYYERSLALDQQTGNEFGVLATLGNLANVTWALGDLDATEASFRQQVSLVRASPSRTNRLLGWKLTSLAGVLTERGELAEALVAAREGLPLVGEDGSAWIFLESLALRAGLAGKLSAAARIAGYADQIFANKKATRHPIDTRHRKRLDALLRENVAPHDLARLLAEGATMTEDDACRLALEE